MGTEVVDNPNGSQETTEKVSSSAALEAHKELPVVATIREDLVSTAVQFLLNPKVINNSTISKRDFLIKRGLTDREIDIAFERSIASGRGLHTVTAPLSQSQQISLWSQTRIIIPPLALISAFCYGGYYVYKKFIEPRIFGPQRSESDRVQDQLTKLSMTVEKIEQSIRQVENNLKLNMEASLIRQSRPTATEVAAINELKNEVSTIKSLLLSRNQFPAPPNLNGLPTWQLDESESVSTMSENKLEKESTLEHVNSANGTES